MNRIQSVSQSVINASAVDNLISFSRYSRIWPAACHLAGHSLGISPDGHLAGYPAGHLGGQGLRVCPVGGHLLIFLPRAASVTLLPSPFLRRLKLLKYI